MSKAVIHDPSTLSLLRHYQIRLSQSIQIQNSIALLPTGLGEPAIAADAIFYILRKEKNKKGLMFVPTISLVDQQSNAIHEY